MVQGNYVFSPDDKHLAYAVNNNDVVVDSKLICDKAGVVGHIFFSPDNNHIYWVSNGNFPVPGMQGSKDGHLLYVDGKPATHYQDNGTFLDIADGWDTLHPEFSADDVMTFIARTDGNLRRFHVKSDTDLGTILAAAPAMKAN
jgi:hypothetical protein